MLIIFCIFKIYIIRFWKKALQSIHLNLTRDYHGFAVYRLFFQNLYIFLCDVFTRILSDLLCIDFFSKSIHAFSVETITGFVKIMCLKIVTHSSKHETINCCKISTKSIQPCLWCKSKIYAYFSSVFIHLHKWPCSFLCNISILTVLTNWKVYVIIILVNI